MRSALWFFKHLYLIVLLLPIGALGQGSFSLQFGPGYISNVRVLNENIDMEGERTDGTGRGLHAGVMYHTNLRSGIGAFVGLFADRWVIAMDYQHEYAVIIYPQSTPAEEHLHQLNGELTTTRLGIQIPMGMEMSMANGIFARAGIYLDLTASYKRHHEGDAEVLVRQLAGPAAMQGTYTYHYSEEQLEPDPNDLLPGIIVGAGWTAMQGFSIGADARFATNTWLAEDREFGGTPRHILIWLGWTFSSMKDEGLAAPIDQELDLTPF